MPEERGTAPNRRAVAGRASLFGEEATKKAIADGHAIQCNKKYPPEY
jgi:hypothetical protein